MKQISIEQTDRGVRVVNRFSPPAALSRREYELLAGNPPQGLLPVEAENEKQGGVLSCTVGRLVSLREYFSGIVSRKMFTDVVAGVVSVVKNCEEAGLDPRNLYLEPDSVFLDPRTKEIRCIFWPLENNPGACDPEVFFRELPYSLVFNKNEDCGYVADYIQYFRNLAGPFSIPAFERFLNGTPPAPAAPGEPAADPLKWMVEQKVAAQRNSCPECGITNAPGAKICASCGAALMMGGAAEMKGHTGTGVLGYGAGSTDLESEESPYPYLIREVTNQIISVDKPAFCIGKDKENADFCVADNSAVSRRHAVIHIREDRYFIVDQNSTNKTSVDGRAIPPGEEIEIFPGAKIKLANEEFVFYI